MTDPTSNLPKESLTPDANLRDNNRQVGGAYIQITANAEAIKNQPLFDESLLKEVIPSLNDHLKTAQGYAENWLSKYGTDVLNTLEHVIAYDTKFQNFYQTLVDLANDLEQGENLSQFKKGLLLLENSVTTIQVDVGKTYDELTTYRKNLEEDCQNLKEDIQTAQTKLGSLQPSKDGPSPLFSADQSFVAGLDDGKIPDGLKDVFKTKGYPLNGTIILNKQTEEGKKGWAINEVSYQEANFGTQKAYSVNYVYVLELENGQLNIYKGKQGKIADLQARYQADQDAMRTDIAIIEGGAAAAVTGVLVIVVGVLAEIPSGGLSTGVIAAGVVLVVGGVASDIYGGVDYNKKLKDASDCLVEIAKDEALLAVMPHVLSQVNGLLESITSAETALGNLLTAWSELTNKLKTLQTALSEVNPGDGPFLVGELNTAKDGWLGARSEAEIILCKCQNMPPTVILPTGQGDISRPRSDHPAAVLAAKDYEDICSKKLAIPATA